jgi:hypothetical protein
MTVPPDLEPNEGVILWTTGDGSKVNNAFEDIRFSSAMIKDIFTESRFNRVAGDLQITWVADLDSIVCIAIFPNLQYIA